MVTFYDQFNRPLERATLEEPQTASLVHLHREFASHPTRGLTPSRLAAARAAWLRAGVR